MFPPGSRARQSRPCRSSPRPEVFSPRLPRPEFCGSNVVGFETKDCFMIGEVPIVTFDTNTHNRLADDPRSGSVLAAMRSMWFRFSGTSIEELFAAPSPRRNDLFASCRKIQNGPSECFLPSNLLMQQLILAHFKE